MYRNTKIATCSYCGNRSALVLDEGRHELVCPSCGAPLHELKAMPVKEGKAGRARPQPAGRPARPRGAGPGPRGPDRARGPQPWEKRRKKKKRKSLTRKLFEEAFDLIEDIFD